MPWDRRKSGHKSAATLASQSNYPHILNQQPSNQPVGYKLLQQVGGFTVKVVIWSSATLISQSNYARILNQETGLWDKAGNFPQLPPVINFPAGHCYYQRLTDTARAALNTISNNPKHPLLNYKP